MVGLQGRVMGCDLCGLDDAEQIVRIPDTSYVRCGRCGFIYRHPRAPDPMAENERAFTEAMREYIDAQYSRRKQRVYGRLLRRFARFRRTRRLLEIGSNVGGFLYRARQMGWQAVGVEPVEVCARYAREQHGLEVIPATLVEAELDAGAFDVVFSNAVVEHLASPSSVLAEVSRVLRPGGAVYTKTVNYDCYTREGLGPGWKLMATPGHLCLFTPRTLRRLYTQAGLQVVSVRSNGFRNPPAEGARCLLNWLRKPTLSVLSRFTLKGDRIAVLGRKPA